MATTAEFTRVKYVHNNTTRERKIVKRFGKKDEAHAPTVRLESFKLVPAKYYIYVLDKYAMIFTEGGGKRDNKIRMNEIVQAVERIPNQLGYFDKMVMHFNNVPYAFFACISYAILSYLGEEVLVETRFWKHLTVRVPKSKVESSDEIPEEDIIKAEHSHMMKHVLPLYERLVKENSKDNDRLADDVPEHWLELVFSEDGGERIMERKRIMDGALLENLLYENWTIAHRKDHFHSLGEYLHSEGHKVKAEQLVVGGKMWVRMWVVCEYCLDKLMEERQVERNVKFLEGCKVVNNQFKMGIAPPFEKAKHYLEILKE